MRKFSIVFISCVLILIGSNLNAAVVETFDNGLGGWFSPDGKTISWAETGGNTGGYALFQDVPNTGGTLLYAPDKYLGDWSGAINGGTISFDHKLIDPGREIRYINPYGIEIVGKNGHATWSGDAAPTGATDWVTVTAPIEEAQWHILKGSWEEILADVTEIRIDIELVYNDATPGDVCGIDNIAINNVPIPGALWLFGSGLLGVLGFRRATKK